MIFQDLVNQIKQEARIAQDDSFNATVISLINEAFKEAIESQRPFELRAEQTLSLVANNSYVTLPDNFFIHHQVFFKEVNSGKKWQLTDIDKAIPPAPRGFYGYPTGFQVASGQIFISPVDNTATGDKLILVYYKIPPQLATDGTDLIENNPIIRLEPFIVRLVVRRLRMLHSDDLQVAQMLSSDMQSAAQAYTKDSPERGGKSGA